MTALELDTAVWEEIKAFMLRDEIMSLAIEQRRGAESFESEIAALERRLSEIARQRTNLARAVATFDDEETVAPLLAELAMLAEQRRVLTDERSTLTGRANAAEVDRQKLLDLDNWRRRVATNLDDLSYEERRMILEALGIVVRLYAADRQPRRFDITLAPLPIEPMNGDIVFSTPR